MNFIAIFMYLGQNIMQLLVAFLLGGLVGYTIRSILIEGINLFVKKLDNVVLLLSFIGAVLCLIIGITGQELVSVQILSFYTSFIFSWLLTKKSSKEEFKEKQHDIAKNTYRHIQDIEIAALVTKERLKEILKKDDENIGKNDVEGIIDDINIILTGIRTNEEDWKDMLNDDYKKQLESQDDPETKLIRANEWKNGRDTQTGHPQNVSAVKEFVQPEEIQPAVNE